MEARSRQATFVGRKVCRTETALGVTTPTFKHAKKPRKLPSPVCHRQSPCMDEACPIESFERGKIRLFGREVYSLVVLEDFVGLLVVEDRFIRLQVIRHRTPLKLLFVESRHSRRWAGCPETCPRCRTELEARDCRTTSSMSSLTQPDTHDTDESDGCTATDRKEIRSREFSTCTEQNSRTLTQKRFEPSASGRQQGSASVAPSNWAPMAAAVLAEFADGSVWRQHSLWHVLSPNSPSG